MGWVRLRVLVYWQKIEWVVGAAFQMVFCCHYLPSSPQTLKSKEMRVGKPLESLTRWSFAKDGPHPIEWVGGAAFLILFGGSFKQPVVLQLFTQSSTILALSEVHSNQFEWSLF